MASPADTRARRRAIRFVLLTVFTYSAGFGIIMPVLPELIVELEGVTLSQATLLGGLVAAAYAVFQFLMGPLVGNLGDRFGRRPVFLLSLTGFAIDFVVMGFAQNILWLFVGRSIAGGLGAVFGPANAAMADMSDGANRARGFGMVSAAFGVGFIVGPALGGLLGDFGTRVPFFVAGGMALLTLIYGYFYFQETLEVSKRRPFQWRRANPLGALLSLKQIPSVLGIASVYFLWLISTNVYPVSWAYFAPVQYGWDSRTVGISLTLVGISLAFAQTVLISRLVSAYGERRTALIAMTIGITGMLLIAFLTNGHIALLLCLLIGVQGIAMPSINALMSRRTPPDRQGELQGFNGSLSALSALIAPLVYNSTLSHFTSGKTVMFAGAPFVVSATLGVVALVALLRLRPAPNVRLESDVHEAVSRE